MSHIESTLKLYHKVKHYVNTSKVDNYIIGFIISKTHNRNIVVYNLNTKQDLSIHPYWLMFEKEKDSRIPKEELTLLEKTTAYGIQYDKTDKTRFYLIGYPKISLCIIKDLKDIYNSYIQIEFDNKKVKLLALHLNYNSLNIFNPISGVDIIYQNNNGEISQDYVTNT